MVDVLSREFPRLKVFCTLSPVPSFTAWLTSLLNRSDAEQSAVKTVVARLGTDFAMIAIDPNCVERMAPLKEPLIQLCATYLAHRADGNESAPCTLARHQRRIRDNLLGAAQVHELSALELWARMGCTQRAGSGNLGAARECAEGIGDHASWIVQPNDTRCPREPFLEIPNTTIPYRSR